MFILLILLGFFASAYGTIIGAGGGFLVVPVLLMIYDITPEAAAATGLAIVFINAVSGLPLLLRQKRVLLKMGLILSVGAFPGTFFGEWAVGWAPNTVFYTLFGCLLIGLGVFLTIKKQNSSTIIATTATTLKGSVADKRMSKEQITKIVNYLLVGFLLGVVSSFFGIGGGWLMVPILAYGFGITMKNATATSMFSLALYSFVGVIPSVMDGMVIWSIVAWTGIGVLLGAQVGAILSKKLTGATIVRLLSVLVIVMGVSMFFQI
ncbi:sulfite exporter TauE/SafE family protein [Virgibacillus ainsalahensis]